MTSLVEFWGEWSTGSWLRPKLCCQLTLVHQTSPLWSRWYWIWIILIWMIRISLLMRKISGDNYHEICWARKKISNLLPLFRAENQATKTREASSVQYFIPEVAVVAPDIGWQIKVKWEGRSVFMVFIIFSPYKSWILSQKKCIHSIQVSRYYPRKKCVHDIKGLSGCHKKPSFFKH